MMQFIPDLARLFLYDIFFNMKTILKADTIQSRLRRNNKQVKSFIDEIEEDIGSPTQLKQDTPPIGQWIGMGFITCSKPITEKVVGFLDRVIQKITDGWSRVTMGIAFVTAAILHCRQVFGKNSTHYSELIDVFYADNRDFRFIFLDDDEKTGLLKGEEQVNFLLPLFINGKYGFEKIKEFSESKKTFQIHLFCRQVMEFHTWFVRIKVKTSGELLHIVKKVLKNCQIAGHQLSDELNREKYFMAENMMRVGLHVDTQDAALTYNRRVKHPYKLPVDDGYRLYNLIDLYYQRLAAYIKSVGDMDESVWRLYYKKILRSELNFGLTETDSLRNYFRKKIIGTITNTYRSEEAEYIKRRQKSDDTFTKDDVITTDFLSKQVLDTIWSSLVDLPFERDFKRMNKLDDEKIAKNFYAIYLRIDKYSKNGVTQDVRRLMYMLDRFGDMTTSFCKTMWPNWEKSMEQPVLEDKNLITDPFKTLWKHFIGNTFKDENRDIRIWAAKARVHQQDGSKQRFGVTMVDYLVSQWLSNARLKIAEKIDNRLSDNKLDVDSIEHVAATKAKTDSFTPIQKRLGNLFYLYKPLNSKINDKDYEPTRLEYIKRKSELENSLILFQFGPKDIDIHPKFESKINELFKDWDVSTLESWDSNLTRNKDNVLEQVSLLVFNDFFEYENIKDTLKVPNK